MILMSQLAAVPVPDLLEEGEVWTEPPHVLVDLQQHLVVSEEPLWWGRMASYGPVREESTCQFLAVFGLRGWLDKTRLNLI